MIRKILSLLIITLLCVSFCSRGNCEEYIWHFEGFKRRVTFTTDFLNFHVADALRNRQIFARVDLNTHGLLNDKGTDIRVCDNKGIQIEFYVEAKARFGISKIYCRGGNYKKLHVYFGNKNAEMPS